jgi:hypothetical protein
MPPVYRPTEPARSYMYRFHVLAFPFDIDYGLDIAAQKTGILTELLCKKRNTKRITMQKHAKAKCQNKFV